MEQPTTINIGNVSDGALVEAFELKLREVLQNIADPHTPATAKREINLRLVLRPKDDRVQLETQFTCTAKLAGLIPWRTFRESAPAQSEFLLRMKGAPGQLPQIALIEADGGKWRLDTIASVATWLREALPASTIIA